ncbi:MAG: M20/M25/M40 family metallo-hydrolase [Planctomycetota bacterium]
MRSLLAVAAILSPLSVSPARGEEAVSVDRRLGRTARFLSSDDLGGRGLGTPGIDRAAQFIRDEFEAIGLRTDVIDGAPWQTFDITLDSKLADGAQAEIVTAGATPQTVQGLSAGKDFNPLAIGGDGQFDLPIAFAGYGITAPEAEYDDYAVLDATGKALIILRHEPEQTNPHSAFNGTDHSTHAPFVKKLSNAVQHGAAAVIFVTDQHEVGTRLARSRTRLSRMEEELAKAEEADPSSDRAKSMSRRIEAFERMMERAGDPLLDFKRAGDSAGRDLPVICMTRAAVDRLLAAAGKDLLADLEEQIDSDLEPRSFDITGYQLRGGFKIDRQAVETSNVVSVLESEGDLADEILVIGAHYDHLGRGGQGSAEPGSNEVHNGADDNASGVTALLEIARRLASLDQPLRRTVVFVAFTGEERGLLGSAEYVRNPPAPLEQTVAMLNFDMVGRLTNNKLIVNGSGTAASFDAMLDELNDKHGFEMTKSPGGFGPSDHTSFYAKQIPVLHFFTDLHNEYHRPDDDFELLNLKGIRRIAAFAADVAERIANAEERVAYVEVEQPRIAMGKTDPRPYFGSIPDFGGGAGGYAISGIAPGSPAAEGGLKGGDKIIRLADLKIGNLEDFDNALRKFAGGDKVAVVVLRDDEEVKLEVVLAPPK